MIGVERVGRNEARRIALAAQGFGGRRLGAGGGRVDGRHLRQVLRTLDVVQIDSVNVLVRSQEMPLFARLGPHRRDLWHRATHAGDAFEAWCHEASLLPIDHWPLQRWRRDEAVRHMWGGVRGVGRDRPDYVEEVYAEVAERGPLSAGQLSDPGRRTDGMWGRSDGKNALEHLFWLGRIGARRHPGTFARTYDLIERIVPAEHLAAPAPDRADAQRELLRRAARAHGIAGERALADYHRLNLPEVRPRIAELVEEGTLVPVEVPGWAKLAYLHCDARRPRRLHARALLSPFDSLVWERHRTEELFGFRYRIEIYTKPQDRVHGYYVLPFLLGDRLVARVDLKADRPVGTLRVQSAFAEPDVDEAHVAAELADELRLLAGWLGLDRVEVVDRGDLAPRLTRVVRSS